MLRKKIVAGVIVGLACVLAMAILCGCSSSSSQTNDPIVGTWTMINEDGSPDHDYECTFLSNGRWKCDWMTGKYGEGSGSWENTTESFLDYYGGTQDELVALMSEQYNTTFTDVQVYLMDGDSDVASLSFLFIHEQGSLALRLGMSDGSSVLLGKY